MAKRGNRGNQWQHSSGWCRWVCSSFTASRSVCAPKARRTSRTTAVSAAVRPPCPRPPPDAFPGVFSPWLDAAQRDFQSLENLPLKPQEPRGLQGRSSRAARVSASGFQLAPCCERTERGGGAVGAAWPGAGTMSLILNPRWTLVAANPPLPQPRAELCSLLEAGMGPGGAVGAGVLLVQGCPAWPQPTPRLAAVVGVSRAETSISQQQLGNPFNSDPI